MTSKKALANRTLRFLTRQKRAHLFLAFCVRGVAFGNILSGTPQQFTRESEASLCHPHEPCMQSVVFFALGCKPFILDGVSSGVLEAC